MEGGSHYGRMNGEMSNVPITTLAGIASLTDLLPELPVPGPSAAGPQNAGTNILYNASVAEQANRALSTTDDATLQQIVHALANTSTDYVELNEKNVSAASQNNGRDQPIIPNCNLTNALYSSNPTFFTSNRSSTGNQNPNAASNAGSWSNQSLASDNSVNNTFSSNSAYTQQQASYNNHQIGGGGDVSSRQEYKQNLIKSEANNGDQSNDSLSSGSQNIVKDEQKPKGPHVKINLRGYRKSSTQQQAENHEPSLSNLGVGENGESLSNHHRHGGTSQNSSALHSNVKNENDGVGEIKCEIPVSKLSNSEVNEMQKSVTSFADQNPKQAEELGVTDSLVKRKTRGSSQSLNSNNIQANTKSNDIQNNGGSDASEDEDSNSKGKRNKFFKASEAQRVDDFQRKRKNDNSESESFGKRRRQKSPTPEKEEIKPFVPKKVTRKVERKLAPMLQKIDAEELMDTNMFVRFNKTVDLIFENMEDVNMQEFEEAERNAKEDDSSELPPEILIPKYQLQDLASETAKLKSLGAMESIPNDKLVKLLNILELNIRDGSKVVPLPSGEEDDDEDENKMWLELAMERVTRAADSSLTVLHILTSKNMAKSVYSEDVIDRVVLFLRFQLSNTIYPSYDPVYKEISKKGSGYMGNMKKKRNYAATVRDKNIIGLYSKCRELTDLLADLVKITLLTDTTVLHISTIGVAPFFVESIQELQLSALKLVRNVFGKYEKHRKLLLDDILASIARLPSSKRSLRTYRLDQENHIQMLTALVLQLIQCVVTLPKRLASDEKDKTIKKETQNPGDTLSNTTDYDMQAHEFINNRMHEANGTAYEFLTVFLKKCGSKNEDIDYRPLFENFVQDLLTTVNTPEWPAAELLLSFLGRVLRDKFCDRSTEMTLRISSLEYLGVVAARLRKDAVESKMKVDYIDSIITIIKEEEEKERQEEDDPIKEHFRRQEEKKKSKKKHSKDKHKEEKQKQEELDEMEMDKERQRSIFLQRVLLDYLAVSAGEEDDISILNARHFYIAQWFRDANADLNRKDNPRKTPKKKKKRKSRIVDSSDEESDESDQEDEDSDKIAIANGEEPSDPKKAELYRLCEKHKKILLAKILPFGSSRGQKASVLSTHIDHSSAQLIVRYLSSKRPFANSFNQYLTDILKVLGEQSTHVRTKALKCVTMIVSEDPDVLMRPDMQGAVQSAFLDQSTMAREAAIDLVGKFILHKKELITQYYDIVTARILDTGVSVRKRVIKILKDICLEFPGYERIPDICVKMIRRINDEEGIRKLVMEVFQNMWFIPVKSGPHGPSDDDSELLVTRARNITDVVIASRDTGLEWFEQLLQTMFKPKEDKDDATKKATESNPQLVMACQQIVDCLVESVLRMEETNCDMKPNDMNGSANKSAPSLRVSACLTTLYLFSKTRPLLLVGHVQTLQPYLSITCKTQSDYRIVSDVARTLELTVPLIKHPSEIFLAQLEEDAVKLILQHDKKVVSACLSCLGSVVNEVTKNFKLIRDCFDSYFTKITVKYKKLHEANPSDPRLMERGNMVTFRRALFTVGLLLRHFDFSQKELYDGLQHGEKTVEHVFSTMFYFMRHNSRDIQSESLNALGFVCVRHYNFMLEYKLKNLYIDILSKEFYPTQHKTQVLSNIELYLQEEDIRMIKHDKNWKEYAKKENLKEMGDVTSGMASTVIQVYLKSVLDSFVHPSLQTRHSTLKVIQLILAQGLVHPVQIVPYLICMATDMEQRISHTADRELQDIEKKYPGFIHMKLLQGIKLSYTLQKILQQGQRNRVVRGSRSKDGELPSALNGFLYSILKNTKAQRRGILTSLLKQFEEHAKSSLPFMLYLADNLAYIPFTVVDEPLFVIHHIDIMISVSGSNLLQTFKEKLKPPESCEARTNLQTGKTEYIYDEDLDDDEDSVFDRLPDNVKELQEAITCSQGCMLLLVLREHLKDFYGFPTSRINEYSPTDVSKANERSVNRRNNVRFNPKATIDILSQGNPPDELDDDQKRELVQKFIEFKELMNKMDPDEEEEDEDGNPIKRDKTREEAPPTKSNSTKSAQIQSSTPSPSKPIQQPQQNLHSHSVPMYNNILPQQSLPPSTHTNPNQQHMQYNPEYYQYQQQQLMLLEEQNRRLAADRYSQHMVAYPQTNMQNNLQHQHQHHANIPRVPEGMVIDPMTGEMVPAGGMRHF